MTISSRTPEGLPNRCPVCGNAASIEPSFPPGDAPCPSCGHLLWWFQDHLSSRLGVEPSQVTLDTSLVGADSLDVAELVMELEEEFDITVSDEAANRITTIKDAIAYIEQVRRTTRPPP